MSSIEKFAAYYRAYQPHERSLVPVAMLLANLLAIWLLLYLVSLIDPAPTAGGHGDLQALMLANPH
jgi:hypothetical protein